MPPPGIRYTLSFVPNLLASGLSTYVLINLATRLFSFTPPSPWVIIAACALSRPLSFFATKLFVKPYFDAQAASALGARLAPTVPGSTVFVIKRVKKSIDEGYPGDAFHEFFESVGQTYRIGVVSQDLLITTEPDHLKDMLSTQFNSFVKGPVFSEQLHSLIGNGIFCVDGELWKFHRAMSRPFFSKERIADFEMFEQVSSKALEVMKERLSEGQSLDFQDLVGRFTFDIITEYLCGNDVGTLSAGIPYPSSADSLNKRTPVLSELQSVRCLEAFEAAQAYTAARCILGQDWPLTEFWGDKVKPRRDVMDQFTMPMINDALKKKAVSERLGVPEGEEPDSCFLDYLVRNTDDESLIKDEVISLLVAGRDPPAAVLTFGFYMLTEHSDVESKLREEILSVVGREGTPTAENMQYLKYTRAFINEVFRLYPPIYVNFRTTNKPVTLPSPSGLPFYVPADTLCIHSALYMNRRKDLWGPDALQFDPLRFIDDRLDTYLTPKPYIFTPFNAGPRLCLGQQFAYNVITYFLVRIVQNFTNFELDAKENLPPDPEWKKGEAALKDLRSKEKIRVSSHFLLHVKGGLWVKMKPIKE